MPDAASPSPTGATCWSLAKSGWKARPSNCSTTPRLPSFIWAARRWATTATTDHRHPNPPETPGHDRRALGGGGGRWLRIVSDPQPQGRAGDGCIRRHVSTACDQRGGAGGRLAGDARYVSAVDCASLGLAELQPSGADPLFHRLDVPERQPEAHRRGAHQRPHWHDAAVCGGHLVRYADRKSTRLNSSHQLISYAVFCLKKKKKHVC